MNVSARLYSDMPLKRLGADALGFVFFPPSPRYIAPEKAADIIARLPPFVTTTGLFVDATAEQVVIEAAAKPGGDDAKAAEAAQQAAS